jgi:transposase-like protein
MAIKKVVLDALLAGADGKDVFGKNGLFDALIKTLAERMLNAEMDHHLTQEAAEPDRIAPIIAVAIRKRCRSSPTVAATRILA